MRLTEYIAYINKDADGSLFTHLTITKKIKKKKREVSKLIKREEKRMTTAKTKITYYDGGG